MHKLQEKIDAMRSDSRYIIFIPLISICLFFSLMPFIIIGYYFIFLLSSGRAITDFVSLLVFGLLCSILAFISTIKLLPHHDKWVANQPSSRKDKVLIGIEYFCGFTSGIWAFLYVVFLVFPLIIKTENFWLISAIIFGIFLICSLLLEEIFKLLK